MKRDRQSRSRVFVDWCLGRGEAFRARTFTSVLRDFLKARSAEREAATVNHDYRVLVKFGEYLASKGFTEPPDRASIKEVLPNEESAENWVPDWKTDLSILNRLYNARFDSEDSLAAWRLVLIVRGLACRPTEAIHLAWSSIDLAAGTVTFKDRKNRKGKRRRDETMPIVLQWVADGLAELKALGAKPGDPVCVSTLGAHWSSEAMSAKCIGRARRRLKITHHYKLKAAQRAAIAQLEDLRFSPYLIAHLAGHSLKTQEEHYTRADNYWRVDPKRDLGRWDKLTPLGEQVRSKFADPLPLLGA
jgi:integrase